MFFLIVRAVSNGIEYEFVSPIGPDGLLNDADALLCLWEDFTISTAKVDPSIAQFLHSTRNSTSKDRNGAKAAIQNAFERLGVTGYYDASSTVLSLYASGRTTGVTVGMPRFSSL